MDRAQTSSDMPVVRLAPEAAIDLLHGHVAAVARESGLRVCFIKGPGAIAQGLRAHKISSDADVLVHPGDVSELYGLLGERGWRDRPADPTADRYPSHSVSLYHPQWPADIDLHYRYPGIEADSVEWMDSLFSEHLEWVTLAHQDCPYPEKSVHALILILHGLRDHSTMDIHPDLQFLPTLSLDEAKILDTARRWQALGALRPYAEEHFDVSGITHWPKTSDAWKFLQTSQTGLSNRMIALLRESPVDWPKIIFQDIFPPTQTILAENLHADLSPRGRALFYYRRFKRGLGRFPQAVRDLRRFRTAEPED